MIMPLISGIGFREPRKFTTCVKTTCKTKRIQRILSYEHYALSEPKRRAFHITGVSNYIIGSGKNIVRKLIREINFEAVVWISGLAYLTLINPHASNHFHFCLFKLLGFEHCPGCGLGLSISFLLHGDFLNSFHAHPLGSFALVTLLYRIFSLLRKAFLRSAFGEHTTT